MSSGKPDDAAARGLAAGVRFVLVEPQGPANVGACARAMRNLGFRRLVLVRPQCDVLGEDARRMAVGARDVLEGAQLRDALDEALRGAGTVVGTTRRTGKHRHPHERMDGVAARLVRAASTGEVAIVFGREDSGLTDEELDRCTHLVHLLADPSFPSFNLAQAVLLAAYELRRAVCSAGPGGEALAEYAAPHEEREEMFHHLEDGLRGIGFLRGDHDTVMLRRLRRVLGRAALSSEDVAVFRGMARRMVRTAERATGGTVDDA